ncbi:hypothetical protein [Streptomyces herbicida]|nr:hypothetical protein [Streptomyces sp. NEAU-HV9]
MDPGRGTVTHRGRKGNREWELRNRLTRSAARMRASTSTLSPTSRPTCPG